MMRTGIFTLVLSLLLGFSALAAPLDINTHTAAVPEPSFKLAATWFLPDWQAALSGRTDNAPDNSGDRQDLTCSTYGGCAGIPANTTCSQSFSAKGTACYKSCSCKSGYNQVNNADICQGCANLCDTVTAVSAPYGCKTPWPVCPSKCQVAYPDNCHNRTAVPTPYGCQTPWSDCSTKCQTAYPDNCHNRTAVPTPYGCQTPWSDCSTKCQTAYPDNCRNYSSKPLASSCANGCAQGKTFSDCTSRCAVGCKARCDTGYHLSSDQLSCVADSCPSGYEAGKTCGAGYTLEKYGQAGTQYCGKCVVKACATGSTSCAAGLIPEPNGYYSGDSQCYNCTRQTCANITCTRGKKCNPSTLQCEDIQNCADLYADILSDCSKCAIDATELNSTVETIIVTKDTDLSKITVNPNNAPQKIGFQGLSSFDYPACANERKPVLTGRLNIPNTYFNTSLAAVALKNAIFSTKRLLVVDTSVADSDLIATDVLRIDAKSDLSGSVLLAGAQAVELFISSGQEKTFGSLDVSGGSFLIYPENAQNTKPITLSGKVLTLSLNEIFNPQNLNFSVSYLIVKDSNFIIAPKSGTFKVTDQIQLINTSVRFQNPINNRLSFQTLILDNSTLKIYNGNRSNIRFLSLISSATKMKYSLLYISNGDIASYLGNSQLDPKHIFNVEFPSGRFGPLDFAKFIR